MNVLTEIKQLFSAAFTFTLYHEKLQKAELDMIVPRKKVFGGWYKQALCVFGKTFWQTLQEHVPEKIGVSRSCTSLAQSTKGEREGRGWGCIL